MQKQFDDITTMLHANLMQNEYSDTLPLIQSLAHVWQQGYFTRDEFLQMCLWKEPRARRRKDWESHSEDDVISLSRRSLTMPDEARRILWLCRFKGVQVPVASAILILIKPEQYGVIDIRVWQILYLYGEVDYDESGEKLYVLHWLDYLPKLRAWSDELGVSARAIERTLFQHHHDIQTKPLR